MYDNIDERLRPWLKWLIPAVLTSLITTILVPVFFPALILSLCLLFSINFIVNTNSELKREQQQQQFEIDQLSELSKQGVVLPCAYCNTENYAPIRLDEDNEFDCSKCNKTSSVYVSIKSVQQTIPITWDERITTSTGTESITTDHSRETRE